MLMRSIRSTVNSTGLLQYESREEPSIRVAQWNLKEFAVHITIISFVLMVILLKILYHRIGPLRSWVPESLLLIVIGLMFGIIIRHGLSIESWNLTPKLFFQLLLPPIILDSAYTLHNRVFAEFLGTILIYAVVGTILNFMIIGLVLYLVQISPVLGIDELELNLKSCLLFASLIVAVDPVAVLAIFSDIGVDLGLYYMVFGESLLNDAVTVVLYEIMSVLAGKVKIEGMDILLGLVSFFTVSLGGLAVGVVIGLLTCFITRCPSSMEGLVVLLLGYFSYIVGDLVGWSGIISMIGCGLIQAAYAFHNLRSSSVLVVRTTGHMAAELSESVIFLFLGIELLRDNITWNMPFNFWALIICLVSRLVVVLFLTGIINWVHVGGFKISMVEQMMIVYGGLRGAVAFSLSVLIKSKALQGIFISATLFIILFTVVIMGLTMKPLVRLLKIRMHEAPDLSLFTELNEVLLGHTLAGLEGITGSRGRNAFRMLMTRYDDKYIRHLLQRDPHTHDQKIVKIYEKIALKLHYAAIRPNQSELHLERLPDSIKTKHFSTSLLNLTAVGLPRHEIEVAPPECPKPKGLQPTRINLPFEPIYVSRNMPSHHVPKNSGQVIRAMRSNLGPPLSDQDYLGRLVDTIHSRHLALIRQSDKSITLPPPVLSIEKQAQPNKLLVLANSPASGSDNQAFIADASQPQKSSSHNIAEGRVSNSQYKNRAASKCSSCCAGKLAPSGKGEMNVLFVLKSESEDEIEGEARGRLKGATKTVTPSTSGFGERDEAMCDSKVGILREGGVGNNPAIQGKSKLKKDGPLKSRIGLGSGTGAGAGAGIGNVCENSISSEVIVGTSLGGTICTERPVEGTEYEKKPKASDVPVGEKHISGFIRNNISQLSSERQNPWKARLLQSGQMVATRLRTSPMVQSPGRAPGGQIERPASVQILSETKDGIDETSGWRQAGRDGLGKKISDNDENKFERENKKRKAVNEINLEKEKNKGSKEEHKEECSNKHVRNILRKRSVCNGSKMEEEETIPSLTKNSSFPSFVSRIFHSLHTDHHSHATQPIGPEPLTHTTCGEHLRLAIPPAISSRQSLKSPVGPITSRHPCPGRSRSDGAELPPAPTNLSTPKPGEGPPPHAPPHAPPPMMHSRMSSILAPSTLLSSFRQAPSVDLLDSMSNRSFELDIL